MTVRRGSGGAGQVAAGISSVGNQAVTQRIGRALDTRPTIEVDAGQLCNVLLTKPLSLQAMWQYGGQARESRPPQRASPALASWLRRELEAAVGPEFADVALRLAEERRRIHAAGGSTEGVDWTRRIEVHLARSRAAQSS